MMADTIPKKMRKERGKNMARNWTIGEAAVAIKSGDRAHIQDIGRRFPLVANLLAQGNEATVELMQAVPVHISARQLESRLKEGLVEHEDGVEGEDAVVEETPAPKAKAAPAPKAPKSPYEGKSAKELFTLCKERKIKVEPKQEASVYAAALEAADVKEAAKAKAAKPAKAPAKPAVEEDEWDEEEAEEEEAPAPKAKGKAKAKPAEEEDDWDI
jgi:hypothetical protein